MEKERKTIKCSYAVLVIILFATVCFLTDYILIERKTRSCNCPKCEVTSNGEEKNIINNEIGNNNEQGNENDDEGDLCSLIDHQSNPLDFGMNSFEYSSENISKIDYKGDMQNNKVFLTAYKDDNVVWQKSFDVVIGGQQDYFDPISIKENYLYLQLNGKIVLLNLESGNIVKELSFDSDYIISTVSNMYENSKYIFIIGHFHQGYSFSDEIVIIDKENNTIKNVISLYIDDVSYGYNGEYTENNVTYFNFIKENADGCSKVKYDLNSLLDKNFHF